MEGFGVAFGGTPVGPAHAHRGAYETTKAFLAAALRSASAAKSGCLCATSRGRHCRGAGPGAIIALYLFTSEVRYKRTATAPPSESAHARREIGGIAMVHRAAMSTMLITKSTI